VVLEVFQLGVLFPAAAFNHTDCIEWLNPMGVDMHIIRDTIVMFGYGIWGSVLIIGVCSGIGVVVHGFIAGTLTFQLLLRIAVANNHNFLNVLAIVL
jgi:hypothetical protein